MLVVEADEDGAALLLLLLFGFEVEDVEDEEAAGTPAGLLFCG